MLLSPSSPELTQRAANITLLVIDADGVLTDGRIVYAEYGDELKSFDVQDGAGLIFWNRLGLRSAIISGRKSRMLKRRAREMRVDHLAQGQLLKARAYAKVLRKFRMSDSQACVIGDDLMELPLLLRAGLAVAVPSAVDEVKQAAHYLTRRQAGRGAVREVVELILKAKGLWDNVLQRYS